MKRSEFIDQNNERSDLEETKNKNIDMWDTEMKEARLRNRK